MEHESFTIGVHIPTVEQPPRHVVLADTGTLPTIEFRPGSHETSEGAAGRLTRHVLSRLVGVDAFDGIRDDGAHIFRTKPIDPSQVALHAAYRFTERDA